VNYVLYTSSGFGECEAPVLYDGGLTHWVQIFDGLRREKWVTLVPYQVVWDVQFLAKPRDALRLRDFEVMDGQNHLALWKRIEM